MTLETCPIQRLTEDSVKPENAEMPFDLVIFATGFYAQNFQSHIEMIGTSRKICSDRRQGFRAYQGVVVEDMLNFATLYEPNTNLGHISVMLVIEAQARYGSSRSRRCKSGQQPCDMPEAASGRSIQRCAAGVAKGDRVCQIWMQELVQGRRWRYDEQLAWHRNLIPAESIGTELG